MKFTLSWLKEHLSTDATLDQIVETMVKVGLEVEEVDSPAERLAAITLGRIKSAEKHPDADKLQVCTVDTKEGELQIVCGAPNAREGINVAFAPVGTYIPGLDVTLTKAKIRGVESLGMMCSSRELELGDDHDGIMELEDAPVGTPLSDVLGLDDPVIDFEVTPNRPDTNGVDGVARDLAAAGLGTLIEKPVPAIEAVFDHPMPVELEWPEACPVFASRVIRGVKNGPSPQWLQDRLRAIGLRPINALADVTNFLSYDRARPLHVYDMAKLSGRVVARKGREGESFEALDNKEYTVDDRMCVIADDARVLGIGGVMGGTYSGCEDDTTDVLIESAWFDPMVTAQTGRRTGIISDARYRFERGVDPETCTTGLDRATAMILSICGGEASELRLAGDVPELKAEIEFPPAEVERLTGLDVSDSRKEEILTTLGFTVKRGGTWSVTRPSARPDIEGKADLVEEIARIYGLDHLPSEELPPFEGETHGISPVIARERAGRRALAQLGLSEAVTWAFCDAEAASLFGGENGPKLSNPISSDLGVMRPSALPNLLSAVGRNVARGREVVRLFEVGGAYRGEGPKDQDTVLAAVLYGAGGRDWRGSAAAPDVFDAKALALDALEAMGAPVANLSTFADGPAHYHPGRKGALGLGPKKILARFGEIHPGVLKALDLPGPIAAIEIDVSAIPEARAKGGKTRPPLKASALMPLYRDFAFVMDKDKSAEALLKAVRGADKALIENVRLFDIYEGPGVPEGSKSVALELVIQPADKTLTDEEIESISAKVVAQAQKAVGASLRS